MCLCEKKDGGIRLGPFFWPHPPPPPPHHRQTLLHHPTAPACPRHPGDTCPTKPTAPPSTLPPVLSIFSPLLTPLKLSECSSCAHPAFPSSGPSFLIPQGPRPSSNLFPFPCRFCPPHQLPSPPPFSFLQPSSANILQLDARQESFCADVGIFPSRTQRSLLPSLLSSQWNYLFKVVDWWQFVAPPPVMAIRSAAPSVAAERRKITFK